MEQELQKRSARVYFSAEDDLHLLREVVGQNPYENPSRWNLIQTNLMQIIGKYIAVRTLRDRVQNLVKKYLAKDNVQQFKSGIEEEITELDDLLRMIADLMAEFKNFKGKNSTQTQESSYQKGFLKRESAMSTRSDGTGLPFAASTSFDVDVGNEVEIMAAIESNDNLEEIPVLGSKKAQMADTPQQKNLQRTILTPVRKRSALGVKQASINYLSKKNDRWYEIRMKELALQERSKALEEEQFQLERWERKKRVELEERRIVMDEKKLKLELDLFKNQQKLIEIAFRMHTEEK